MKKQLVGSALLLLLFLISGLYPIDSLSVDALLVGYGGDRMLPFIDGATLTFFVGEELELKSIGSPTNITIIDPSNRKYYYFLEEGTKLMVMKFNASDVGTWLVRHPRLGTMSLRVIDNYSPKEYYISIQKINDNTLRLSLKGPALMGFLTNNESRIKVVNPSGILTITIPQGMTYVRITLEYNETIELSGLLGSIQYHYKTNALVSEYVARFKMPITDPMVINFEIPEMGKVGKGGIIPLRAGPIKLKVICTGPGMKTLNYVDELLVIPTGADLKSITRTIDINLTELINNKLRIAYYNISTGIIDSINVRVPIYRIIVYDKTLSRSINNYSFSIAGMLSIKTDNITYIVPTRIQFDNENNVVMNPRLIVYSVDISNMIKNITLKKEEINSIIVESKEINLIVRHADGTLINNALILVNSSTYSIVNGSTKIRIPIATYNFSAITSIGHTSSIIDISKTNNVQLIIRTLSSTIIALIIISVFQGTIFLRYILKLLMLKRTLKK